MHFLKIHPAPRMQMIGRIDIIARIAHCLVFVNIAKNPFSKSSMLSIDFFYHNDIDKTSFDKLN